MSDVVQPCCKDFKLVLASAFWRAMFASGDRSNMLDPDWGPSLAILGPVKISGRNSSASWREVGGSSGQVELSRGHVEAKLGHVEAICQILFGHVVAFASRNAVPPVGPTF